MSSRQDDTDDALLTLLNGQGSAWCMPFVLLIALRTLGHDVDEAKLAGAVLRLRDKRMVEVDPEQGVRSLGLLERMAQEA